MIVSYDFHDMRTTDVLELNDQQYCYWRILICSRLFFSPATLVTACVWRSMPFACSCALCPRDNNWTPNQVRATGWPRPHHATLGLGDRKVKGQDYKVSRVNKCFKHQFSPEIQRRQACQILTSVCVSSRDTHAHGVSNDIDLRYVTSKTG